MNNINLVFFQFYTMQSLFKCLEENKTPQFKKWKCRMTFAMEVNAAVDFSGLVLLGLSLQKHPSEDRHALQRQGGIIKYTRAATSIWGDQHMTLSECDKLAEILPAASSRPSAAFETLTALMQSHHHSNRPWFHALTQAHPKPFSSTVTERLI